MAMTAAFRAKSSFFSAEGLTATSVASAIVALPDQATDGLWFEVRHVSVSVAKGDSGEGFQLFRHAALLGLHNQGNDNHKQHSNHPENTVEFGREQEARF